MSSTVDAFGGSFFNWFQDEVLPYMLGSLYIVVMILGIVFNAILITTIRKNNMLEIRTNRFMFELAILDLISCILFIFPSIIVAFMKQWKLSDYVCKFHGTVFTFCYMVTFGFLIVMSVERATRAKNFDRHDRFFLRSKATAYVSALIWIIGLCVACIPHTGWVSISYDFYHAACVPEFGNNVYYLAIVFTFGICFCIVSYTVTYALIFSARKRQLESGQPKASGGGAFSSFASKNKTGNNAVNAKPITGTPQQTTPTAKIGWGAKADSNGKPKSKFAALKVREKMKKAVTKTKITKMFSNDNSDPDFTLAVTYLIVACLMIFLWLPYIIISFVSVSDKDLWGGFRSIVTVIAMLSYALKPVIYLAHNKKFRTVTTKTMPKKMVEKARNVRNSINTALDKIDNIMFMSASTKKFRATIKTTLFAKRWLRKARASLARKAALAGKQGKNRKSHAEKLSLKKIDEDRDETSFIHKERRNKSKRHESIPSENTKTNLVTNIQDDDRKQHPNINSSTYNGKVYTKSEKDKINESKNKQHNNSKYNEDVYTKTENNKMNESKIKRHNNSNVIAKDKMPKSFYVNDYEEEDPFGTSTKKSNRRQSQETETQHPMHISKRDTVKTESRPKSTDSDDGQNVFEPQFKDGDNSSVVKPNLFYIDEIPTDTNTNQVNSRVSPKISATPAVPSQTHNGGNISNLSRQNSTKPEPNERNINTDVNFRRASIITSDSATPIIINSNDGLTETQISEPQRRKRTRSLFHSLGDYQPTVADDQHNRRYSTGESFVKRNATSVPLSENPYNRRNIDPPFTDRGGYHPIHEDEEFHPPQRNTYRPAFLDDNYNANSDDVNRNNQVEDLPSQINQRKFSIPLDIV